jgi:gliding motility-associated-like protein
VPQQGACPSPVFELLVTTSIQPDAGSDGILERCLNAAPILLSELPDSDANTNGIWLFNDEQLVGNSFTPASSGTLEYLVDAEWPCIPDIAEWEILVLPLPGFEAGNDINACSGTTSVQIGQDTNADWSFIWSPADNLDDPFSPDPSVTIVNEETQTTEITYTVTISDGICTATDALDITIFPLPEVVAGENVILCEGEQLTLNASGPEELSWSTEDWLEDLGSGQASIIAVESSWLVVTGLNEFGCPGTDSLYVEVRPAPELTVEIAPLSGCAPLETTLTHNSENEEGTFYYWIINDELSQNGNVLLQEPGTYSVTLVAVGTNGCSAQASFEESILVHPSPVAYFEHTPEQVDIYDQSISLNNLSSDADFWIWNFEGSSSEEWSPQFDILPVGGTYLEACLEVMNEFGCIDSICRYIEVLSDLGVFVPNAFSPNQDGRNESFYPVIHGYDTSDYLFQVYDRWGMLLFESKVPGEGWNGNYLTNSELVPPDIYVWQLFINSANEAKRFAQRGHVSIVR